LLGVGLGSLKSKNSYTVTSPAGREESQDLRFGSQVLGKVEF
jgi:hypothetical protein